MSEPYLPPSLRAAAEWMVEAKVVSSALGEGVVEVSATNGLGQAYRWGVPLGWPAHYEDRDMEAAGLTSISHIMSALADRCSAAAREKAGLHPPATD